MRLVIVHNIIAPYRIPLFNLLAASPGIDLNVLFMAETESNRQWDVPQLKQDIRFAYEVLAGLHLRRGESTLHINPRLVSRLGALRPDVVIVTSLSAAAAICLAYRPFGRYRLASWWAGTAFTEQRIGAVKRAWRHLLIPTMDAFLCYSRAAADYLRRAGATADKVFTVGNVTFDAEDFRRRIELARPQALEWRKRMGLQEAQLMLCVGQLILRKNHRGVLHAFSRIQPHLEDAALAIVGEGPLRADLERLAADLGLRRAVFTGQVQPSELPIYYAAADLFVDLTLRDHWSQVVGEAMAAGLPALVSSADHASELIEDGVSGFVVDPADVDGVAALALRLLTAEGDAKSVGGAAREAARMNDVHHTMQAFVSCLDRLSRERGGETALETPG